MNDNVITSLTWKLQSVSEELSKMRSELLTAAAESAPGNTASINDLAAFGAQLNARRKALGIDLALLELQTGVSVSTLKRVFKDPEQVKFGTVVAVARALGVTLCSAV